MMASVEHFVGIRVELSVRSTPTLGQVSRIERTNRLGGFPSDP
jgi:hypothetical protein